MNSFPEHCLHGGDGGRACSYLGMTGDVVICDYAGITGRCRLIPMEKCEYWKDGKMEQVVPDGISAAIAPRRKTGIYVREKKPRKPRQRDIAHIQRDEIWLELYRQGKTDQEIAEQTGHDRGTVNAWRRRNGLPYQGELDFEKRKREREELYRQGKSDREIADALGIKRKTVTKWREVNGLPVNGKEKK